jgi:DNA-binding MarR family transcriptional regulator
VTSPTVEPLRAEEQAVIRALGRAMMVLPRIMEADLLREQQMSLSEYSALMHLSEAPDQRLRMSSLALACDMSQAGMTRVVTRLEGSGLVTRMKHEPDARGSNAVLTAAGLARLQEAWPTHLASVRRHVLAHLDGLDLSTLAVALGRLATDAGCVEAACTEVAAIQAVTVCAERDEDAGLAVLG